MLCTIKMWMEVRIVLTAHAVAILVFDASKPDSMDTLDNWLKELNNNNVGRECTVSFLL